MEKYSGLTWQFHYAELLEKSAENVNRHANLAQETEYTVKSLFNEFLEEWLFLGNKVSTKVDYAECYSSSCNIFCIQL